LALKADGTVWAWGDNEEGQLGDGTTEYRSTPVQVKDLKSKATAIFTDPGTYHSMAITSP
jgi:alpha-tubulin suppressor-like RCC1 family protein